MSYSVAWRIIVLLLLSGWQGQAMAQHNPASSEIETILSKPDFQGNPAILAFYRERNFGQVWSGSAVAEENTRQLMVVLSRADRDGLDPARYRVTAEPSGHYAARDIAVTAAALTYMQDLAAGRADLEQLDPDVALPPHPFDAAAALDDALRHARLGNLAAELAPHYPEYAYLRSALARYRAVAAQGGWPVLAAGGDYLGKDAGKLLQRLIYENGPRAAEDNDPIQALKAFQLHHGLPPDGVVGPRTLAELNIPAAARADTIAANMERWRWLPSTLEPDRIVINVADAQLQLWLDNKVVLTSRVIVGRPHHPTPILRAEGAGVTVNPPWNIPASIAAREILPKLKANHSYLVSQNMTLVDGPPGDPYGLHVNWRSIRAGSFPYRIRQYPGPRNALGRVKLELPNRFAVYLHDTPGKSAFALPRRDASHGCVRVEQILPLASYALVSNLSAVDLIARTIEAGETKYLPLHKKLPVYFLYWTAFTGVDDIMEFRPDIYGRDTRLIAASRARSLQLSTNFPKCNKG
jgi:murein L,D-transpeptidase YcbB/YkuD